MFTKKVIVLTFFTLLAFFTAGAGVLRADPKSFLGSLKDLVRPSAKAISRITAIGTGSELTRKGVVFQVRPGLGSCYFDVLQTDGGVFQGWVDFKEENRRERIALCSTVIEALGSQKTLSVHGIVGSSNPAILDVDDINYFEGETLPTNAELIASDCSSFTSTEECTVRGTILRILNWAENGTTACMAIIKLDSGKQISSYVRQGAGYERMSPAWQMQFDDGMQASCHDFAEALSTGRTVEARGKIEDGGTLALIVNRIFGPTIPPYPYQSAF